MRKGQLFFILLALLMINPARAEVIKSRVIEEGGTGPHSALMLAEASLPTHTVFRPQNMGVFGADNPLPLIVWGNGACFDSPWEHINFLNEIASHGFLVIATGLFPEAEGEPITTRSTSSKLIDAMNWAINQNDDEDSAYFQKVATQRIAASGMSCGGLQALEVAGDERITALLIANSGLFNNPGTGMPMIPQLPKSQLKKIHSPTLYLLGGPSDIAYENGMDDVERINHVPVFVGNLDVGHGGTYGDPYGGEYGIVATAWFQWQLKADETAGQLFVGEPPGLSEAPGWDYVKKPMPQP